MNDLVHLQREIDINLRQVAAQMKLGVDGKVAEAGRLDVKIQDLQAETLDMMRKAIEMHGGQSQAAADAQARFRKLQEMRCTIFEVGTRLEQASKHLGWAA